MSVFCNRLWIAILTEIPVGESGAFQLGDERIYLVTLKAENGLRPGLLYESILGVPGVEDRRIIIHNHWNMRSTMTSTQLRTSIDSTQRRISTIRTDILRAEADRPENVIVVVLTDGKENASETPQQRVREKVTYRQQENDWEFLFIGANQDAALTAESMGMDSEKSLNMHHSGDGVKAAQESTSRSISRARQEGTTGGYDESDRNRQNGPESR